MFFDDVAEIQDIATRTNCAIFILPKNEKLAIKNALILQPEEKSTITIDQVKDILAKLSQKQTEDLFIIIRPAESLGPEAANAMLKTLEEPGDKVHFILITDEPSRLLPTILSRAEIYILRDKRPIDAPPAVDAKILDVAKRLIAAKPTDLPSLAEEITKKKDGVRAHALEILATAIEVLYKSYYKTDKIVFVQKLPKFLNAYDAISRNGHIKLHLVADLL